MPAMSKPILFKGWMLLVGRRILPKMGPGNWSLSPLLRRLQDQQEQRQTVHLGLSSMNDFLELYILYYLLR